jgi:hypothetical protein
MTPTLGKWVSVDIPAGASKRVPAMQFVHPNRCDDFPPLYRLLNPHPLRPPTFTPTGDDTTAYKDYVVLVRKERTFMEKWQKAGEDQDTPCDDVGTNLLNGTFLLCPM